MVRCSKTKVPKNICEGRTSSFDKFVDDQKNKLQCRVERFAETLRKQKGYRSRTNSLHRKFQRNQKRRPHAIEKVDRNNGQIVSCLQNLGIGAESWDPILIYLVTERLDPITRKDWEQHACENSGTDLPSYSDLKRFVENRATALEAAYSKIHTPKTQKSLVAHVAAHDKCPFCKDTHKICAFQKFIASPIAKRKEFVKTNNLCFNSLSHVHQNRNCTSAPTLQKTASFVDS